MSYNDSKHNAKTPPPQLSATFIPGHQDNYHMPVVSPIPQRSMPEVPDQMQQNLAKLELDAGYTSPPPPSMGLDYRGGHNYEHRSTGSNPQNLYAPQPGLGQLGAGQSPQPSPRISSSVGPQATLGMPIEDLTTSEPFFPHIIHPPPNIPPRAEETERMLETARQAVLTSNNVDSQITWAQDTLAYVHSAMENNARLAEAGMGRSRTPQIEHQLRVDAFRIISFLADQHHPKAEFLRGTWLEFGRFGLEVDKLQAYRCFSNAARNGYARAEYRIGMQFEETGEFDKALRHYSLGVQAQDAASYYRVGMMYLLGQNGQHQDIQRGLDYIKYSANNADENAPQGAYVYGMLLARELPQVVVPDQMLPPNNAQAKYYLEKAAYLGFSQAQTRLGTAYEQQQLGCDFDPVYSLHYNQLAARQGEPEAEMAISKWFLSGYDGMFPKNEALAYEYALRAAISGFPTAEFAMGYFYEVGIHVPSNLAEAKVWYGKAAEHGNQDAKGRITGISRSKTLSRKDHDDMALAKIKSVRGRPRPTQRQSLQMPQIDSYRQPSPAPVSYPPNSVISEPYRKNQYYDSLQGSTYIPHISHRDERPTSYTYSVPPNIHGYQSQSVPPVSTAYSQPPPISSSPAIPYSNRQSSLPQGTRMSSQGLPSGSGPGYNAGPAYSHMRQNFNTANKPNSSPQIGSGHSTPTSASFPVDIGYSAPADFAGADRRRLASGPALGPGQGAGRPNSAVPPRKPMSNGQVYPAISRPSRTEALQSKPAPDSQSSAAAAPTPPPVASVPPQAGKKPGKGPSTFAEMGIPQKKQESDCIVM